MENICMFCKSHNFSSSGSGLLVCGVYRCVTMPSDSCEKFERRPTKRALDGRKRGAKSKFLNGKGGSKAARQ